VTGFTTPTDVAALRSGDGRDQAAIDVVTALMRGHCRQTLTRVADDTVTIPGTQGRRLLLGERPVVSITSPIIVDGVALADSEWRWNRRGSLYRFGGWGDEWTDVEVTYTHGFATLPDDLAAVCRTASIRLATNTTGIVRFEIMGDFSKEFGPGTTVFGFLLAELAVLDRYRRRTLP
jgi:hypothetical protein